MAARPVLHDDVGETDILLPLGDVEVVDREIVIAFSPLLDYESLENFRFAVLNELELAFFEDFRSRECRLSLWLFLTRGNRFLPENFDHPVGLEDFFELLVDVQRLVGQDQLLLNGHLVDPVDRLDHLDFALDLRTRLHGGKHDALRQRAEYLVKLGVLLVDYHLLPVHRLQCLRNVVCEGNEDGQAD